MDQDVSGLVKFQSSVCITFTRDIQLHIVQSDFKSLDLPSILAVSL